MYLSTGISLIQGFAADLNCQDLIHLQWSWFDLDLVNQNLLDPGVRSRFELPWLDLRCYLWCAHLWSIWFGSIGHQLDLDPFGINRGRPWHLRDLSWNVFVLICGYVAISRAWYHSGVATPVTSAHWPYPTIDCFELCYAGLAIYGSCAAICYLCYKRRHKKNSNITCTFEPRLWHTHTAPKWGICRIWFVFFSCIEQMIPCTEQVLYVQMTWFQKLTIVHRHPSLLWMLPKL